MPRHPLANFEMQKYYHNDTKLSSKNEPKFDGVYSRNNVPRTKDGTYVTNLDEFRAIGTHWIALYVKNNNVTYFDSFGVKHISKEI